MITIKYINHATSPQTRTQAHPQFEVLGVRSLNQEFSPPFNGLEIGDIITLVSGTFPLPYYLEGTIKHEYQTKDNRIYTAIVKDWKEVTRCYVDIEIIEWRFLPKISCSRAKTTGSSKATWQRTGDKVKVTEGRGKNAKTKEKIVYMNSKTGERRVRKMVTRGGERKAAYVKF